LTFIHLHQQSTAIEEHIAYRLAGHTILPILSNATIGIRFETFWRGTFSQLKFSGSCLFLSLFLSFSLSFFLFSNQRTNVGQYFECYYASLALSSDEQSLIIDKHTFPWFLPLQQLASKYLNDDMRRFVREVGEFLDAFVARRETVKELKGDEGTNVKNVNTTDAHDHITFEFDSKEMYERKRRGELEMKKAFVSFAFLIIIIIRFSPSCCRLFYIRFDYNLLNRLLPTRVVVRSEPNQRRQRQLCDRLEQHLLQQIFSLSEFRSFVSTLMKSI
jgi:hypothetical protein